MIKTLKFEITGHLLSPSGGMFDLAHVLDDLFEVIKIPGYLPGSMFNLVYSFDVDIEIRSFRSPA